ncbi:MAG TPA: cytochrome C oxidase subunit IV family protein [Acidimicrobiia bacterium]|jgi:cytochrome c oxidase subunit 4|nr:cytochrome C oxidase subunit IV family protein [Acidimicrobiia bacterium]
MADETATSGDTPEPPGSVATEEPQPEPEQEQTPELEAGDPGQAGLALVHHAPEHSHPTPAKYVGIAVFLAIVTALEVALYYITMPEWLVVVLLLVLATMKFAIVAGFFMHLKFDSPMLRRVFVTGIVLAGVVYTIALLTLSVLV